MPTKACICQIAPERATRDPMFPVNMVLDHRCPLHGEKSQPDVWGRHKDLQLTVTAAQWDALKIEMTETN